LTDISILFRSVKPIDITKKIVTEFDKHNIPYVYYKRTKFRDLPHIRKTMVFLNLVFSDVFDEECIMSLCSINERCEQKTLEWVRNIYKQVPDISALSEHIKKNPDRNIDTSFLTKIISNILDARKQSISSAIDMFYKNVYPDFAPMIQDPMVEDDIDRLHEIASGYDKFKDFERKVSWEYVDNKNSDGVLLSTVHSAKGLEWHTVFIIGLIDTIIPNFKSKKYELDEEKNVLYVALTRAKENLYLSYSKKVDFGATKLSPYLEFVKSKFKSHQ
jgi:DNA helicase II / ATP-dependent DNA helicase PcrA